MGLSSAFASLAVLLAIVAACICLACRRRRRADKAELKRQASAYSEWQNSSSMPADPISGSAKGDWMHSASGTEPDIGGSSFGESVHARPASASRAHAYVFAADAADDHTVIDQS